ncbi:MAG: FeoA family protein [Candidatus Methylomirabilales bacterium]
MRCPMCRAPLDEAAQVQACRNCPLYHWTRGCRLQLIRCPRCGYHSLPGEGTAASQAGAPAVPPWPCVLKEGDAVCVLGEVAVGAQARVVGFDSDHERDVQRLVAYGLVPGVRLTVLQRVPATIIKIHETELALEHSLAKAIYVLSDHQ